MLKVFRSLWAVFVGFSILAISTRVYSPNRPNRRVASKRTELCFQSSGFDQLTYHGLRESFLPVDGKEMDWQNNKHGLRKERVNDEVTTYIIEPQHCQPTALAIHFGGCYWPPEWAWLASSKGAHYVRYELSLGFVVVVFDCREHLPFRNSSCWKVGEALEQDRIIRAISTLQSRNHGAWSSLPVIGSGLSFGSYFLSTLTMTAPPPFRFHAQILHMNPGNFTPLLSESVHTQIPPPTMFTYQKRDRKGTMAQQVAESTRILNQFHVKTITYEMGAVSTLTPETIQAELIECNHTCASQFFQRFVDVRLLTKAGTICGSMRMIFPNMDAFWAYFPPSYLGNKILCARVAEVFGLVVARHTLYTNKLQEQFEWILENM